MIATSCVARYLPEIPLPNERSLTHLWIPILQVVSKIASIRLTLKLFTSLSKVYVNQEGANWSLVINEVNLLFYITRRNLPHKTYEKNCAHKHCISDKCKVRHYFYLKWALFWWFEYLMIQWKSSWESCWECISLDFVCLPFLDFLCHLKYRVKQHLKEREKFHVICYLIFVKNKNEVLLLLYPKFHRNT